jgi:hypothetical protein
VWSTERRRKTFSGKQQLTSITISSHNPRRPHKSHSFYQIENVRTM